MDDDFDNPEILSAVQAVERSFQGGGGNSNSNSNNGTPASSSSRATAAQRAAAAAAASSSSSGAPKVVQPTPQVLPRRTLPSAILVSSRQKGNPILSHIGALPWEYTETPADYVLGETTCALFLSLKYHRLHPEYIYGRIRQIAGRYTLRVLLCLVDIDNHEEPLRELAKTSLVNDLTLMLAWSAREAARYLEAYRSLEKADPTGIRGARSATFAEHMTDFVTTPRGVNKTDAVSLVGNFGSVRNAVNADKDLIMAIPGWGEKKAERFRNTVNEPFRAGRALPRKRARENEKEAMVSHEWQPDEDEEEQMAALAESNLLEGMEEETMGDVGENTQKGVDDLIANTTQQTTTSNTAKRKKASEPQLTDGVQAALAKLRKQ